MTFAAFGWFADLLTFILALSRVPIASESNPLARYLWTSGGPLGVTALKVAAFLLCAVLIARLQPGHRRAGWLIVGCLGLIGAASNVSALVTA